MYINKRDYRRTDEENLIKIIVIISIIVYDIPIVVLWILSFLDNQIFHNGLLSTIVANAITGKML